MTPQDIVYLNLIKELLKYKSFDYVLKNSLKGIKNDSSKSLTKKKIINLYEKI